MPSFGIGVAAPVSRFPVEEARHCVEAFSDFLAGRRVDVLRYPGPSQCAWALKLLLWTYSET